MDKIKVLLATQKPFAKSAVEAISKALKAANFDFEQLEAYADREDLMKKIVDFDALIVRSDIIDKEIIQAAPKLKLIVRGGSGYDNIDIKAAYEAGVIVMNTPGQNANAVAELVFGLLVYNARNKFNGVSGTELKGKTLGIHAFGNVGANVARIAKGFGMNVIAFDPYTPAVKIFRHGVTPMRTEEDLYKHSDVVSLHLPFTPMTKGVVNKKLLTLMPEGAVVINTARKEIVDENDMLVKMKEDPNFSYLTDIAPDQLDEFMNYSSQFFATPKKMGAQTVEANNNAAIAAAQELINFFVSGNVDFKVN